MILLVELLAVLSIAVVPQFLGLLLPKRIRERKRFRVIALIGANLHHVGIILLILYIALHQESGLLSIGVDADEPEFLLAGVVLISIFFLLYVFIEKCIFKVKESTLKKDFEKEVLSYKSLWQKILLFVSVSLAAVSEELIFRGYFILIWGQRTGYPILYAVLSGIIFIVLHLHRGRKAIPYYTAATVFLVVPTLFTGTIMISLGMHLYLNVLATLGVWIRNRGEIKKQKAGAVDSPSHPVLPTQKKAPLSAVAIILMVCSWIVMPLSLFIYAIPSLLIILLAVIDMIRIKKSKGRIRGRGLCIAAICLSLLPILAIAALFALPLIFN